jgi:hypothetical protein
MVRFLQAREGACPILNNEVFHALCRSADVRLARLVVGNTSRGARGGSKV